MHEVKLILAQSEDTEFPETANVIYVAVAQGTTGSVSADSSADVSAVPALILRQLIVALLVMIMLIASGIWLGRELTLSDSSDERSN